MLRSGVLLNGEVRGEAERRDGVGLDEFGRVNESNGSRNTPRGRKLAHMTRFPHDVCTPDHR